MRNIMIIAIQVFKTVKGGYVEVDFSAVSDPIVALMNSFIRPLLLIFFVLQMLAIAYLALRYMFTINPELKSQRRKSLLKSINSYVMVFVIMVIFQLTIGPLSDFAANSVYYMTDEILYDGNNPHTTAATMTDAVPAETNSAEKVVEDIKDIVPDDISAESVKETADKLTEKGKQAVDYTKDQVAQNQEEIDTVKNDANAVVEATKEVVSENREEIVDVGKTVLSPVLRLTNTFLGDIIDTLNSLIGH